MENLPMSRIYRIERTTPMMKRMLTVNIRHFLRASHFVFAVNASKLPKLPPLLVEARA
jgi:hypothetical protein